MSEEESANEPAPKRRRLQWNEDDMLKAVSDVQKGSKSVRQASKLYNVPRQTLHDKATMKAPLQSKPGPNTVLSYEEERELCEWAKKMTLIGYGQTKAQISSKVKELMKRSKRKNPFKDGVPGKHWWQGFLKRHPDVKLKTPEPLQIARAQSCTSAKMDEWFLKYQRFIIMMNMLEGAGNRVWNADETGFTLCPKTGKVLAARSHKNVLQITGNNKTQITTLCAASASGAVIPPFHVFSGTRLPFNPLEGGVDGSRFALSKNGWMTTEIFHGWIVNHFAKSIPPERPVVLLVDGHSSHLNMDISTFCQENSIEIFCLPPHASHITQPLDVSFFKSIKSSWKDVVHEFMTNNPGEIPTTRNFARIFRQCWMRSIKSEVIINGFRASGVYPVNRKAIDESKLQPSLIFNTNPTCVPSIDVEPQEINRNHSFSETNAFQVLKTMEAMLGDKMVLEFQKMLEENYDIPYPLFDSWKILKMGTAANGTPVIFGAGDADYSKTIDNEVNVGASTSRKDSEEPCTSTTGNPGLSTMQKQKPNTPQPLEAEFGHCIIDIFEEDRISSSNNAIIYENQPVSPDLQPITDTSSFRVNNSTCDILTYPEVSVPEDTESALDIEFDKSTHFEGLLSLPQRRISPHKTKRKAKEIMPQHLTSEECVSYFREKKDKKEKLQKELEERRLLREKKKQERLEILAKKAAENKTKIPRGMRCKLCNNLHSKRRKGEAWYKCEVCEKYVCKKCSNVTCDIFFYRCQECDK